MNRQQIAAQIHRKIRHSHGLQRPSALTSLEPRKTRRIPAAAQRFDKEHVRHQPLSVNHGELLFIVEQILLRVDDSR